MDVKDILAAAEKAVDEAGIKGDLRTIAFEKAVELVAASAGMPVGKAATPSGAGAAAKTRTPSDGSLLASVADKLKLDVETVKEVFHEADGKFDIIVPSSKLEKAKSTGMKQIALLVAAARQGGELEEFTDADQIRSFAEQFKKYDGGNFATDLQSMTDEFRIRRDGRKIYVKLSRPGLERATELVKKLAGEEPA